MLVPRIVGSTASRQFTLALRQPYTKRVYSITNASMYLHHRLPSHPIEPPVGASAASTRANGSRRGDAQAPLLADLARRPSMDPLRDVTLSGC